ncbi:hypothetical protein DPMN_111046 [Dreissena polymorpha]|uniref:Uncharacterized protein n=1 Tax=Dreissena polymorpha TaxID=45954 RepID=A0A9D4QNG3_DREPO|nr:hypothetical protein DPMN_111046 [Dreissena polymorpha]
MDEPTEEDNYPVTSLVMDDQLDRQSPGTGQDVDRNGRNAVSRSTSDLMAHAIRRSVPEDVDHGPTTEIRRSMSDHMAAAILRSLSMTPVTCPWHRSPVNGDGLVTGHRRKVRSPVIVDLSVPVTGQKKSFFIIGLFFLLFCFVECLSVIN